MTERPVQQPGITSEPDHVDLRVCGNEWILPILMGSVGILIWGMVSLQEERLPILGFFLLFGLLALGLTALLAPTRRGFNLLLAAMLIRTIAAVIAYYTSPDPNYIHATGTNEDSIRFFEASFLPLKASLRSFEEPGFSFINYYITNWSKTWGGAHYLSNIQFVLWSGSLFPVIIYTLVKDGFGEVETAYAVGWLLAIQPIAIAFSTGLMRDAVIGTIGWLLVLLVMKFKMKSGVNRVLLSLSVVLCVFGLATLRVVSAVTFLGLAVGAYMVFSGGTRSNKIARPNLALGLIFIILLIVLVLSKFERILSILNYSSAMRSNLFVDKVGYDGVNPNGITERLWNISPLFLLLIAPLQIMQPIPFYSWNPHPWIGGPPRFVDILIGFGGLMNQLLFIFFLGALYLWKRNRQWGKFYFCGIYIIISGWINLIGMGQIRYMMAHAFPLFVYSVVVGYQNYIRRGVRVMGIFSRWVFVLFGMYTCYSIFALFRG